MIAATGFAGPLAAQDTAEVELIRRIFAEIQPVSIREKREYCGYVGINAQGSIAYSKPVPGEAGSCLPDDPVNLSVITASYHTHGNFSPDYWNEVPSVDDVEGDIDEGIDGYVATPGGRLWYIDSEARMMSQLCGLGCLPSDPEFVPGSDGDIAQSYSLDALIVFLAD